jgi:hypothetical protein
MFIYEGVLASDSDVNCYVIIRKLLFNTSVGRALEGNSDTMMYYFRKNYSPPQK